MKFHLNAEDKPPLKESYREEGQKQYDTNIQIIMQVKVLFFGVLSEVAGTDCKHYNEVLSIGDLRIRIQDDYPEMANYSFRISVNSEIINDEPLLNDGDEIAFMPPFAGG